MGYNERWGGGSSGNGGGGNSGGSSGYESRWNAPTENEDLWRGRKKKSSDSPVTERPSTGSAEGDRIRDSARNAIIDRALESYRMRDERQLAAERSAAADRAAAERDYQQQQANAQRDAAGEEAKTNRWGAFLDLAGNAAQNAATAQNGGMVSAEQAQKTIDSAGEYQEASDAYKGVYADYNDAKGAYTAASARYHSAVRGNAPKEEQEAARKEMEAAKAEYVRQGGDPDANILGSSGYSIGGGALNTAAILAGTGAGQAVAIANGGYDPTWEMAMNPERYEQRRQLEAEANQAAYESLSAKGDEWLNEGSRQAEAMKRGEGFAKSMLVDIGIQGVQMASDAAVNAIIPGGGLMSMGVRVFGQSASEARAAGADIGQQAAYGAAAAAVEVLTEMIGGGLDMVYGKGATDQITDYVIGKLAETELGRAAWKVFLGACGEGTEEVISDLMQPVIQRIYTDEPDALDAGQMAYDWLIGAVMGFFGNAGEVAAYKAKGGSFVSAETDYFANAAQNGVSFKQACAEWAEIQKTEAHNTAVSEMVKAANDLDAAKARGNGAEIKLQEQIYNEKVEAANRVFEQEQAAAAKQEAAQGAAQEEAKPATEAPAVEQAAEVAEAQEAKPAVTEEELRAEQTAEAENKAADAEQAKPKITEIKRRAPKKDPNHIDNRSMDKVGNRSVQLFSQEHPELYKYFDSISDDLARDVATAISNDRMGNHRRSSIVDALMATGMTKGQIFDAIDDLGNGVSNANSKRVELAMNEMLSRGYTDGFGNAVMPNADYINAKAQIKGGISPDSFEAYLERNQGALADGVTEEELRAEYEAQFPDNVIWENGKRSHRDEYGFVGKEVETQNRQAEALGLEKTTHVQHMDTQVQEFADDYMRGTTTDDVIRKLAGTEWWTDVEEAVSVRLIDELNTKLASARGQEAKTVLAQMSEARRVKEKNGSNAGRVLRQAALFNGSVADFVSEAGEKLTRFDKGDTDRSLDPKKAAKHRGAELEDIIQTAIEGMEEEAEALESYEAVAQAAMSKAVSGTAAPKVKSLTEQLTDLAKKFATEKVTAKQGKNPMTGTEMLKLFMDNSGFFEELWEPAQSRFGELVDEYIAETEKLVDQDTIDRRNANDPMKRAAEFTEAENALDNKGPKNKILTKAIVEAAVRTDESKSIIKKQVELGTDLASIATRITENIVKETGASGDYVQQIYEAAYAYAAEVAAGADTANVSSIVGRVVSMLGETYGNMAKKSGETKAQLLERVTDEIVAQYAIDKQSASAITEAVQEAYTKTMAEAMEREIERRYGDRAISERKQKRFIEAVQEEINLGTFDSAYSDKAMEKYFGTAGLKHISAEAKLNIMNTVRNYAERLTGIDAITENDTAEEVKAKKESLITLIHDLSAERRTTAAFRNEDSASVSKTLNEVAEMDGGYEFLRKLAETQVRSIATDYIKVGFVEKLKSVTYLNALSNVATSNANISANTLFGDVMCVMANNASIMPDAIMSLVTGEQRTVRFDRGALSKEFWSGLNEGLKKSFLEVALDAEVAIDGGKYAYSEIQGSVFHRTGNWMERYLACVNKWQGYAMKTTDQLQKGGTEAEIKRGLMKGGMDEATATQLAHEEALYRTLQTKSKTAKLFTGAREFLNGVHFGNERTGTYGLGDMVLKFAQVPANSALSTVQFNPISALPAFVEYLIVMTGDKKADAQARRNASQKLGRAATGFAWVAIGYSLSALGLVKNSDSDDKDEKVLDAVLGKSGLQWNLSATLRSIAQGQQDWQAGDVVVGLGYLPQLNACFILGDAIRQSYEDDGTLTLEGYTEGTLKSLLNSFMEFPAVSTISTIYNNFRYADAESTPGKLGAAATGFIGQQVAGVLQSNLMRNIAAGLDDYQREVYTARNEDGTVGGAITAAAENAKNNLIAGTPFLRETLGVATDNFGEERKSGAANFVNKVFLPGDISVISNDELRTEVARVAEASGNAGCVPDKNYGKSIKFDGEEYRLSAEERRAAHIEAGQTAEYLFDGFINSDAYGKLNDEQRADVMHDLLSYADQVAERSILLERGIIASEDEYEFSQTYMNKLDDGSFADYLAAKTIYGEAGAALKTDRYGNATADFAELDRLIAEDYADLDDSVKEQLLSSYSHLDELVAAAEVGIGAEEWYSLYNAYNGIKDDTAFLKPDGNTDKSAQATAWSKWLNDNGYKGEQKELIADQMRFWSFVAADSKRYDTLFEQGLDSDTAYAVVDTMNALEPLEGAENVSNDQKYDAATEMYRSGKLTGDEYLNVVVLYAKTQANVYRALQKASMTAWEKAQFWATMGWSKSLDEYANAKSKGKTNRQRYGDYR